jgi:hypothetical protein
MTKREQQDVLVDIMMEINILGSRAFNRKNKKDIEILESMNNRVVYLWGMLDTE